MKRWFKYKDYLEKGWWHIHTDYTDGENSIDYICQLASKLNIPLVAFTEHVRQKLTYDFDEFINDIKKARKIYSNLIILIGCEAKVIDLDGNLDVQDSILKKCDIVLGAFHGFPYKDKKHYLIALMKMLTKDLIDIWAHPTMFAQRMGFYLSNEEIDIITKQCKKLNILIEKSLKYDLPKERFNLIAQKNGCIFVKGGDVHSKDDITRVYKIKL